MRKPETWLWPFSRASASAARRRVLWNWCLYSLGNLFPQALSILLLPVFTRYLSPHDYGILSYTTVLVAFFMLAGSLAIQPYLVRYFYECPTKEASREFFGTIFLFLAVYNLALLGAALALGPLVFRWFGIQVPFAPYVQLALLCAAIETLALIPLNYFRARERAGAYIALSLAMTVLNGGLSLYLVAGRGMGVLGKYVGQLAGDVVLLGVFLLIMARIAVPCWRMAHVQAAMAFCLPLVPAQFLATVANMADRLILERKVSLAELGMYSIGFAVASSVVALLGGVYSAIQPYVCRLASESRLDEEMPSVAGHVLLLAMTMIFAVTALSRDGVRLIAAPPFHESYKLACVLVVAIVIQAYLTLVPSLYLLATQQTKYETPVRLVGTTVGFICLLVLTPRFGTWGAGAAAVITALATLGAYRWVLCRHSRIQLPFGRHLLLMGASSLAGYAVLQVKGSGTPLGILAKVVLIGLVAAWTYRRLAPGRAATAGPSAVGLREERTLAGVSPDQ